MILFGFSIGYWFQRNKNSNTGQTESQTKLKENTKETGETYTGITSEEETETADTDPEESQTESVTEGTEEYRGFVIDNVLQSEKEGDTMSISRKAMMEQRHMHCILHCRDMKDFIFRELQPISGQKILDLKHRNITVR